MRRETSRSLTRWLAAPLMASCVCLMVTQLGCSDELDPTAPGDAYLMFRDAMWAGDAEAVWARTDPETHAYFQQSYEDLTEMSETIERYLPQADHRLAKRQAGVILLREAEDGKGLFLKIFQPEKLPKDEAYKLGSDVAEVEVAEDESFAKIKTRGGREYYLTKGDDEQWYVMLHKSAKELGESMAWLESNKTALSQTVDDLIAEERKKREAIIAELMKP